MYSHQEASLIRKEFWTVLGQYLAPIPSSEGSKINWINYRTGVKHVHFRMDAIDSKAFISLEFDHPDTELQRSYFELLFGMKCMLESIMLEPWEWQALRSISGGKPVSRVFKEMEGVKVLNRNHWPELISFFKPRIIRLDEFWTVSRDTFLYH